MILSPKLKNFLTYKGSLSRVGFVLVAIGVFLTIISFVKGIQILMFIPALVASLFIHSYGEIRNISKKIQIIGVRDQVGYTLKLYGNGIDRFYFRIGIRDTEAITMLQNEPDSIDFHIPLQSRGEIIVFFTGSFDILRYIVPLFRIQENTLQQDQIKNDTEEQKLSYIHIQKYETGDQAKRMDSIRSSIRNHPYIKTLESGITGKPDSFQPPKNSIPIHLQSSLALVRKNDLAQADIIHIFLILLNFIVIFVQWKNFIFSGMLLLTILIVTSLKKTLKFRVNQSHWYKNGSILVLFLCMLLGTYFQGDMALPGSIFLTQILIIKKLFPDNKEDGFLYIFLSLFVFVAVAITSTALWFILFFLGYLMLAILLLSTVSGYGFNEHINASIGTRNSKKSYFTILTSIFFMMGILFFILPHGEAKDTDTSSSPSIGNQTISGFSSEINLNNVSNIKKDLSKKIVISHVEKNQVDTFKNYYWRGKRFMYYIENKWTATGYEPDKILQIGNDGILYTSKENWNPELLSYFPASGDSCNTSEPLKNDEIRGQFGLPKGAVAESRGVRSGEIDEKFAFCRGSTTHSVKKWDITYYTIGIPQLFFPKIPKSFELYGESKYTNIVVSKNDPSLYNLAGSSQTPVATTVYFRYSNDREQTVELPVNFTPFTIKIPIETEKLFEKFWNSIDENLQKNPNQLAAYIRNRAGFRYSIDAPASSLKSFLYEEKQGHCEYFATVLALTLQHFGYQATIVNGFHGGEWNQLMGAFVVQGQDAHAWVELHDPKKHSWMILDATPNQLSIVEKLSFYQLKTEFFKIYDYLDISWYTYIANYGSTQQKALLLGVWKYRYYVLYPILLFFILYLVFLNYQLFCNQRAEVFETKLLRYLGGTKKAKFVLKKYNPAYPDLVQKTRTSLYCSTSMKKSEYQELRKEWKIIFDTSKR